MKTIYWFINNPILLAFLTTYVLIFLCLDLIHAKTSNLKINKKETLLSIKEFFLIGGIQATLCLTLIPALDTFYPYRLQTLTMNSPIHWIASWIFVDFIYYWIHRFLHHTKIGWCAHAPHHTMTQMTMLDGTRISWGEQPLGVIIYGIPLVIFGVPPHIAGIFYLFIAFYQFIVHTEINWHLGILNKFIFTPAAHRVHHSKLRVEADSNLAVFLLFGIKFLEHISRHQLSLDLIHTDFHQGKNL